MTCVSLHLRSIQFDAIWIYLQDFTPCFFQWRPLKLLHALFCFTEYTGVKYLNATKILKTNDWNPKVENERIFLALPAGFKPRTYLEKRQSFTGWEMFSAKRIQNCRVVKFESQVCFSEVEDLKMLQAARFSPRGETWNYNPTRTEVLHALCISTQFPPLRGIQLCCGCLQSTVYTWQMNKTVRKADRH